MKIEEYLYEAIKVVVFGFPKKDLEPLSADDASALYSLAKKHDLTYIVSLYLQNSEFDLDKEFSKLLKKDVFLSVFRYENLKNDLDTISKLFDKEEIPYIPLKGAVVRNYYPAPEMRSSCDVDIYIDKENVKKAEQILIANGFTLDEVLPHDVSFFSPSDTHIELHFSLFDSFDDGLDEYFNDKVWDNAKKSDDTYKYELSVPFFVAYNVAHTAKHFSHAGTGLKSFIDLVILKRKMGYDQTAVIEILDKVGLKTFYEKAISFSEYAFLNKPATDTDQNIERYILSSGVYGNQTISVANKTAQKGGKSKYILYRIFMPYKEMKDVYPILKKHKILYPFYQIKRWFSLLSPKKRKAKIEELKAVELNQENNENARLLRELNLIK